MPKVKIEDTETGEILERDAVDAREMLAQEDGRFVMAGKRKKAAVEDGAPPAAPKARTGGKKKSAVKSGG